MTFTLQPAPAPAPPRVVTVDGIAIGEIRESEPAFGCGNRFHAVLYVDRAVPITGVKVGHQAGPLVQGHGDTPEEAISNALSQTLADAHAFANAVTALRARMEAAA